MLKLFNTDALTALSEIPDESVQCCVTSPPYYALRDYGLPPLIWDGTEGCEHRWITTKQYKDSPTRSGAEGVGFDDAATTKTQRWREQNQCSLCGAWKGSLGLEPTPDLYVQHLVQIFREVRRVLRPDGTLWLNLGDSYAGSRCGPAGDDETGRHVVSTDTFIKSKREGGRWGGGDVRVPGVKVKDLIGIPWMVAFALRADGWYLRSDIIWAKPNPMPESVTDRPTKSHEYLFLLSKSQKYFYDAAAIAEEAQTWTGRAATFERSGPVSEHVLPGQSAAQHRPNRNGKNSLRGQGAERDTAKGPANREGRDMQEVGGGQTRNRRSVWTVATQPFSEAHFATFPPNLIIPCVLAGTGGGATVLDPFAGSGTVGKVAIELGRKAILIEPSPDYCKMIDKRTQTTIGLPLG